MSWVSRGKLTTVAEIILFCFAAPLDSQVSYPMVVSRSYTLCYVQIWNAVSSISDFVIKRVLWILTGRLNTSLGLSSWLCYFLGTQAGCNQWVHTLGLIRWINDRSYAITFFRSENSSQTGWDVHTYFSIKSVLSSRTLLYSDDHS